MPRTGLIIPAVSTTRHPTWSCDHGVVKKFPFFSFSADMRILYLFFVVFISYSLFPIHTRPIPHKDSPCDDSSKRSGNLTTDSSSMVPAIYTHKKILKNFTHTASSLGIRSFDEQNKVSPNESTVSWTNRSNSPNKPSSMKARLAAPLPHAAAKYSPKIRVIAYISHYSYILLFFVAVQLILNPDLCYILIGSIVFLPYLFTTVLLGLNDLEMLFRPISNFAFVVYDIITYLIYKNKRPILTCHCRLEGWLDGLQLALPYLITETTLIAYFGGNEGIDIVGNSYYFIILTSKAIDGIVKLGVFVYKSISDELEKNTYKSISDELEDNTNEISIKKIEKKLYHLSGKNCGISTTLHILVNLSAVALIILLYHLIPATLDEIYVAASCGIVSSVLYLLIRLLSMKWIKGYC